MDDTQSAAAVEVPAFHNVYRYRDGPLRVSISSARLRVSPRYSLPTRWVPVAETVTAAERTTIRLPLQRSAASLAVASR